INLREAERSGKLVAELEGVAYAWDGTPVIRELSVTVMRGDRIGIIGRNGCGKSTLLNLILGRLQPQGGHVRLGTRLEVAYFDQLRAALDEELTVGDVVADGSDKVEIDGTTRHVISYLQDFLFTPDRVRQPVRALSGGERNRLLLAKLFTRPANVLVLDEPTNDLDLETLELLEERLLAYQGTLLLVSHDRAFLNNVVTSTLVFEGGGRVNEYVGGYDDWLRQRPAPEPAGAVRKAAAGPQTAASAPVASPERPRKLSYKEQRELEQLPQRIETLDGELEAIHAAMAAPDFYKGGGEEIAAMQARLARIEAQLAAAGFTRVVGFEAALRAFPAILDGLLELGLLWMRGGPGHWLDYPMLRQVEALLSDCQSTGLLERVVRFRERPRVSSYISPDGRQAYFPDDIDLFRGIDALRMADCGGYDGDTLLQVARLAGNRLPGLEYVISFEPDPENYRRLAQAAGEARERWPRARFIASPLGVWSETTLLNFDAAGSSSSALSGQGATRVPVVALDAMLG
ncbi:MAG: hypothetical protein B0D87_04080, partial [Candidatus Sedimenticola endophacoides]